MTSSWYSAKSSSAAMSRETSFGSAGLETVEDALSLGADPASISSSLSVEAAAELPL